VRSRSSSDAEPGLNSALSLPSHQNGAHFSLDVEGGNGKAERDGSLSLNMKGLYPLDPDHRSDGSPATLDSGDGKNSALDAETTQSGFAGECADPSLQRKRKQEIMETPISADSVAFQSSDSSQNSQDRPNCNKRVKIGHAGDMTTANYADTEPFRDTTGHLLRDRSNLPPEVWHHVFNFIPPGSLASLLRVNHAFYGFLTPSTNDAKRLSNASSRNGVLQVLDADFIWSASRKLFHPDLPRPPLGMPELDMWKLLCSRTCQFCGKLGPPVTNGTAENQFEPGPGKNGVKIIWQFGVRSCGTCLEERSEKVGNLNPLWRGQFDKLTASNRRFLS
jgi:hypothetical protein